MSGADMTNSGNPLDRPVRVVNRRGMDTGSALVRPSDVLAALTDEQREALAGRLVEPLIAHVPDADLPPLDLARMVVGVICGRTDERLS